MSHRGCRALDPRIPGRNGLPVSSIDEGANIVLDRSTQQLVVPAEHSEGPGLLGPYLFDTVEASVARLEAGAAADWRPRRLVADMYDVANEVQPRCLGAVSGQHVRGGSASAQTVGHASQLIFGPVPLVVALVLCPNHLPGKRRRCEPGGRR
eukprot:scaffold2131_cov384-Prasinococcus_capsulatus_cf.AAC.20